MDIETAGCACLPNRLDGLTGTGIGLLELVKSLLCLVGQGAADSLGHSGEVEDDHFVPGAGDGSQKRAERVVLRGFASDICSAITVIGDRQVIGRRDVRDNPALFLRRLYLSG